MARRPASRARPPDLEARGVLFEAVAWLVAANAVAAVLVFVFFTDVFELIDQPEGWRTAHLVAFVAYVGSAGVVAAAYGRRVVVARYRWLAEGRAPTEVEQGEVLREPWRIGWVAFAFWTAGAFVFAVLNAALGAPATFVGRVVVGILLGGITTCALSFLLLERTMRPVFALALAGAVPGRQRALGLRPRLMLSWAVGSGVPFVGILLAATDLFGEERQATVDVRSAAVFLAAVGLGAGWLAMFVAARSVADPLDDLREAVAAVERGRLDVSVTVDDGGEVGLLQAGVNQMVAGLQERQRLRDLFGRHVGDEVARQALQRAAGLGGEVRHASALFVDLIGSTAFAARSPADEVVAALNALFETVVRVVGDEGGWVNKFEGDGALCVFGAPADQPDHAARALRAARRLRQELGLLAEARPALDTGIGVSSGPVVAGNVGAEERYEYTVVGDPVNEAARLTELAKQRPGRVLASEQAVRTAGEECDRWVLVGEFALRGRDRPTCAYEPAGPGGRDERVRACGTAGQGAADPVGPPEAAAEAEAEAG